jgi:ribosomal protein L12E/L44/L45/RPP1/RPP2
MKKVLSSLVAALVAVSFAGVVFAAEPAPTPATAAPAEKTTAKTRKEIRKENKGCGKFRFTM